MGRKLPVGIQAFGKLRTENFLYVDKTEYIYKLAHDSVPYFLSRPRRFGKSLLISTMKAYWEGKRELFKGLAIEKLEEDNPQAWQPYPVFHFDFVGENYLETPIETVLAAMLSDWEAIYGDRYKGRTLGDRFQKLLETAVQKTGRRCVILVDEYDKPLLDTIDNEEIQNHIKDVFRGFFGRLKKADEYIQFVFITGVTKFHRVSIFSDLNQLTDISLTKEYAGLCGITEDELTTCLEPEIREFAKEQGISREECVAILKKTYDGYRFHPEGTPVYNPFSVLNALYDKEIGSYWFTMGTPSFLAKRIARTGFDVRKFTDKTIFADEKILKDYTGDSMALIPLLYQTGYLTIAGRDATEHGYTLAFPNEEVKYAFLESLLPEYVPRSTAGNGLDIFTLEDKVEGGDLEGIRNILTALFASIPYTSADAVFEHYFQTVIYLVFTLLGRYALCEMHTFTGRIDCKVETDKFIYLFEFKRDESADAALKQIDDKSYTLPFIADSRKLFKIGVSFDSERRILADWKVQE